MPYVVRSQVEGKLPQAHLVEALDDDADGIEDAGVWDKVADGVDQEIDGILGQRFNVPFPEPVPKIIRTAALFLTLEALYGRRGYHTEEDNPFMKSANRQRTKLDRIANSEEPLTPHKKEANKSVSTVTEPARTTSRRNNLST